MADMCKIFERANPLLRSPVNVVLFEYLHVFYFRKWLPEIPQAADWSTPGLIGELTPPPCQDTAVSSYTFIQKLYKSQCSVQEGEIWR